MPRATTTGRHAVRGGARLVLLLALLAFLITTFTPAVAHTPPPDAGRCGASALPQASPPTDDGGGCAPPQSFASPGVSPGGHHDGGHHGPGHRGCVLSACHHRSRLQPLGAPAVAEDTTARTAGHHARVAVPTSAHRASGAALPHTAVLRC